MFWCDGVLIDGRPQYPATCARFCFGMYLMLEVCRDMEKTYVIE